MIGSEFKAVKDIAFSTDYPGTKKQFSSRLIELAPFASLTSLIDVLAQTGL
jgi:hypothetical protein